MLHHVVTTGPAHPPLYMQLRAARSSFMDDPRIPVGVLVGEYHCVSFVI